jgi:putative FmdB family regulatory protein
MSLPVIIARSMPIYEYRCSDGHQFEVFQSMADDPVQVCEVCGKPVERVFSPVAVHYKGSGFYTTDYAKKGSSKSPSSSDGGSSSSDSSSKSDSKSDSKSSSSDSKSSSSSSSDSS